jgi:hypothetical protein
LQNLYKSGSSADFVRQVNAYLATPLDESLLNLIFSTQAESVPDVTDVPPDVVDDDSTVWSDEKVAAVKVPMPDRDAIARLFLTGVIDVDAEHDNRNLLDMFDSDPSFRARTVCDMQGMYLRLDMKAQAYFLELEELKRKQQQQKDLTPAQTLETPTRYLYIGCRPTGNFVCVEVDDFVQPVVERVEKLLDVVYGAAAYADDFKKLFEIIRKTADAKPGTLPEHLVMSKYRRDIQFIRDALKPFYAIVE